MPAPHTHRFHVQLEIDGLMANTLDLALPVWTPGSYMVRDYARHLQSFAAESGGQPRTWSKIDKTTWRVQTGGASKVTVRYEVYAFDLTVRTSHLDDTHGYFNPATLCLFVPGRTEETHIITVVPLDGWYVTTGLPTVDDSLGTLSSTVDRLSSFIAQDYDELVDSPFECGTHRLLTFEVEGVPHEIAIWGHGNEDEQRILHDTKRIVESARTLYPGPLPYSRYVFILHLANGLYGGLEHRNSVSNLVDRWTFKPERSYERFLGLTSHEYYHVWNVKRIRPAPLGPFDYRTENYTRQLWVAEGITSYYDNLILLRSGLIAPERYLEMLADDILTLQSQPGRGLQTLEQSSFDTWIKFYRPDENSANSSISYYLKGSLVALLLDLEIRQRTAGAHSLDDVMRHLYGQFDQGRGEQQRFYDGPAFVEDGGFLAAVEAVAGTAGGAYRELLRRYVETTEELDYLQAFRHVGLRMEWGHKSEAAWLGLRTKVEQGRLTVATVSTGGPAEQGGIASGDELLALDGFRIDDDKLKARLTERRAGDQVALTLFRRDRLLQVAVTLAEAPFDTLRLTSDPEATPEQLHLYQGWISS
jgi:predicted metalloprotease with PDZ domain